MFAIKMASGHILPAIKLLNGFQHGDDILHGNISLDIVYGVEYKSAVLYKDFAIAKYMFTHFFSCSEGQCLLGVDPSGKAPPSRPYPYGAPG